MRLSSCPTAAAPDTVCEPLFCPFPCRCGEQAPRKMPAGAPWARLKSRFTPRARLERSRSFLPAFGTLGALGGARCAQTTRNTLGLLQ
ncbi:hypothetical protein NDU88_002404 [Pleurodeles waltl]|uniref:Uncharacterized protein n=1 Tax=Pleurodeles waltl TaxID=8319 RepID=A0AAV7RD88_PLEWA|nr:hypothetical protein NDU88_002404 [Pleurodeles waltl]